VVRRRLPSETSSTLYGREPIAKDFSLFPTLPLICNPACVIYACTGKLVSGVPFEDFQEGMDLVMQATYIKKLWEFRPSDNFHGLEAARIRIAKQRPSLAVLPRFLSLSVALKDAVEKYHTLAQQPQEMQSASAGDSFHNKLSTCTSNPVTLDNASKIEEWRHSLPPRAVTTSEYTSSSQDE